MQRHCVLSFIHDSLSKYLLFIDNGKLEKFFMQAKRNTSTQNKLLAFLYTFQIVKYNDLQVAIKAKPSTAFKLMAFALH